MSLVTATAKICVPSLPSRYGERILRMRVGLVKVGRQMQGKAHGRRVGHFVVTEQQGRRKEMREQEVPDAMNAIEEELSKIVGLDDLKIQLKKWLRGMVLDERRRAMGLDVGPRRLPQLAFLGNPGTGKTMVARMLGRLLHLVGILRKDRVIEVQRTDLVGQFIGQTGPRTRQKIKEAEGGILFIDEAYRLAPATVTYDDYGLEAIEEIMSFMDKDKLVIIFAGYTKPMDRLIYSNEGMRRRISNIFHFDDLSCEQLAKILHLKFKPTKDESSPYYGFKLDSEGTSVKDVAALIEGGTTAEQRRRMNGGLVEQMLVRARESLDSRVDVECLRDPYSMVAITSVDLAVGLRSLRPQEIKSGNDHHLAEKLLVKKDSDKENVTRAGLGREVKSLNACGSDPMVMANLGYLQGLIDSARSVKQNLPGANLDFLMRHFEEYIHKFPPQGGAHLNTMLDMGWVLRHQPDGVEYAPEPAASAIGGSLPNDLSNEDSFGLMDKIE